MFRSFAAGPLLLLSALPGFAEEPAVASNDRAALRGFWRPVRYEQGLSLFDDFGFGDFSADIDDEHWVNRYGFGHLWVWRYQIDATTEPHRIDFEGRQPDRTGELIRYTRYGIYKIEGDRLTLCFSAVEPSRPTDRPDDFTAKPGSGRILTVFERSTRPVELQQVAPSATQSPSNDLRSPATERSSPAQGSSSLLAPQRGAASPAIAAPVPCEPGIALPMPVPLPGTATAPR